MNKILTLLILLMILVFSACTYSPLNSGQIQPGNAETQQALIEQAVRGTATTSAMLTQISRLETQISQPTPPAGVTQVTNNATPSNPTVVVTQTFTPLAPTATLVPPTLTVTPILPTATPVPPTATSTSTSRCNEAKFEGDISIPDGTVISPGASFTKTWRLRNSGTCTWTTTYDLVFDSGSQMGASAVIDFPGAVNPGQVIDLSVNLTAPTKSGSYRGNWKLRTDAGILFGLGKTDVPFYVDIKVSSTTSSIPLDFASQYCSAKWTNGTNTLPCPGTANDSRGYVLRIDKPTLESGYVDDEPVVLMHPQMITNGYIRGIFPAIRVENGYDFSAVIGCAYKASNCDVIFELDYQIGDGNITKLKSWHEVYDGKYFAASFDVSSLAGKDVKFILTILSNGSYTDDKAQWLAPRINK
ncbi:MAG: hypothetical protein IH586_04215 [Anaerolineaceae bacterium]|nr:hypothetical protein [Anaerolineaceae bacterium]